MSTPSTIDAMVVPTTICRTTDHFEFIVFPRQRSSCSRNQSTPAAEALSFAHFGKTSGGVVRARPTDHLPLRLPVLPPHALQKRQSGNLTSPVIPILVG